MSEQYLWDRSGQTDPTVARLETLLGQFALRPPRPRRVWPRLVAAASILLIAGMAVVLWRTSRNDDAGEPDPGISVGATPYEVILAEGAATLHGTRGMSQRLEPTERPVPLPVGSRLETHDGSRTILSATDIGDVTLENRSIVHLEEASADRHRLFMERGRLRAQIRANVRPRLFQVGTPAGLAVDLGCIYTLDVEDDGSTVLEVSYGCVSFETDDGQVWVPRQHRMSAPRGFALGLPVATGSMPEFHKKVAALSFCRTEADRASAILELATQARAIDTMTLWHLLGRSPESVRPLVLDRLMKLRPPPRGCAPEDLLRGDPSALAAYRVALCGW